MTKGVPYSSICRDVSTNISRAYRSNVGSRKKFWLGPWRASEDKELLHLDQLNYNIGGTGCVMTGFTKTGKVRVENEDGEFLFCAGLSGQNYILNVEAAVRMVLAKSQADSEGHEAWLKAPKRTRGKTYTKFFKAALRRILSKW